jgi:hypothetical protein
MAECKSRLSCNETILEIPLIFTAVPIGRTPIKNKMQGGESE